MLAHFLVFSTDCATNASHLEITKCSGESWGQEPWTLLMLSLKALPHLSHFVTCASRQMSTPIALRGHAAWETRLVSLQPPVPPVVLPPTGSPPKIIWEPCGQFLAASTSVCLCVYVCVCVCVCVCVSQLVQKLHK